MDDAWWQDPTLARARELLSNAGKYMVVAFQVALVADVVQEALDTQTECGSAKMKDVLMESGMDSGQAMKFQLHLDKLFEENGCSRVDILHLETRAEIEQYIRKAFVVRAGLDAEYQVHIKAAADYLRMLPSCWVRDTAKMGKMPKALVVTICIIVALLSFILFLFIRPFLGFDDEIGFATQTDIAAAKPNDQTIPLKHHGHTGKQQHAG